MTKTLKKSNLGKPHYLFVPKTIINILKRAVLKATNLVYNRKDFFVIGRDGGTGEALGHVLNLI